MDKLLTFRIGIKRLENRIWRAIEIPDRRTVADLAYTILASFNSLAFHLYDISYKDKIYDCGIDIEDDLRPVPHTNAVITKLKDLNLQPNDKLKMTYDTGSPTTFNKVFLEARELLSYKEQEHIIPTLPMAMDWVCQTIYVTSNWKRLSKRQINLGKRNITFHQGMRLTGDMIIENMISKRIIKHLKAKY